MSEDKEASEDDVFSLRSERAYKVMPYLRDIFALSDELLKESDRGKVLVSYCLLDDTIKKMILAYMVESPQTKKLFDGFNAPLTTFSTRISLAFALGLISENEYKECDIIRKIRNRFAHEMTVSFEDEQIKAWVNNLSFFGRRITEGTDTVAEKFVSATGGLLFWISHRPDDIAETRLKKLDDTFTCETAKNK